MKESHEDPDVLDANADLIFCLDVDLRFTYCNAAWDRFALANGALQLCCPAPLGRSVLDYISTSHREYSFSEQPFGTLDHGSNWASLGSDGEAIHQRWQLVQREQCGQVGALAILSFGYSRSTLPRAAHRRDFKSFVTILEQRYVKQHGSFSLTGEVVRNTTARSVRLRIEPYGAYFVFPLAEATVV